VRRSEEGERQYYLIRVYVHVLGSRQEPLWTGLDLDWSWMMIKGRERWMREIMPQFLEKETSAE
jgi:hypothetical protein